MRSYEIAADGTFRADDVPHPCPGECVVQHAVIRKGTWKLGKDKKTLSLTVKDTRDTSGSEEKASQPLPAALEWDGKVLFEPAPKGAKDRCLLAR